MPINNRIANDSNDHHGEMNRSADTPINEKVEDKQKAVNIEKGLSASVATDGRPYENKSSSKYIKPSEFEPEGINDDSDFVNDTPDKLSDHNLAKLLDSLNITQRKFVLEYLQGR